MIRKWIVKNFVLGTFVTVFGRTLHTLRAPRVIFPLFALTGIVMSADWAIQWYDAILLGLIALSFWIGFPMFKWSYFRLFPIEYDELDDMQKYDWIRAQKSGSLTGQDYIRHDNKDGSVSFDPILDYLTEEQESHWVSWRVKMLREHYNKRFAGLSNLIPLGVSILAVIIWYNW